jgi:diaminopimelate epimerase
MVAYLSCLKSALASGRGKGTRNGPGEQGKSAGNGKKILFRRNKANNLLKTKELTFKTAQNKLLCECKQGQSKPKNVQKPTHRAAFKPNSRPIR